MNNYQDIYSRYHHKPVTENDPIPSGNGWIYTAYAVKAGLPVDMQNLSDCMQACYEIEPVPHFNRSPEKSNPPISRDEILGLVSLDLLQDDGDGKYWNFSPYPLPKFSLIKLVKQLLEARGKHRNYFWQNNLDQLYRFAFSVPLSDRAFILQKWGKFHYYNPVHLFYAAVGKINSKLNPGALDWLKYDEKKGLEGIKKEFPEDHPIRVKLGL